MTDPADIILVLTTIPPDEALADRLARTLVTERLAACVSVLPPMQSTYRWKEEVEHAAERQVVIKTTPARLADLERALTRLHPYELPELIVLPVSRSSPAYAAWVAESCR